MNIQDQLLLTLWEAFDIDGLHASLDMTAWAEERGLTIEELDRSFEELEEAGFAKYASAGRFGTITSAGIIQAELDGLVPQTFIDTHERFRVAILKRLAEIRNEHGPYGFLDWESILEPSDENRRLFLSSGLFLEQVGLIQSESARGFKITKRGLEVEKVLAAQEHRKSEFARLASSGEVSPQARGHLLEQLIGDSIKELGWQVALNCLASGEENDIIISKDLNYFIASCKWISNSVETSAVRDLRDRVNNRPGTTGILFSVSGFTKGAIDSATERMNECVVLLFGVGDIKKVLDGKFEELLKAKLKKVFEEKTFDFE